MEPSQPSSDSLAKEAEKPDALADALADAAEKPDALADDESRAPTSEPPIAATPIAEASASQAPVAAEALFSLAPALRQQTFAFSLSDYRSRFDPSGSGPLPCFPPPVQASLALPRVRGVETIPAGFAMPFVTTDAGAPPRGTPMCVDEAIGTYLVGGASRAPPNIDVDFASAPCSSNGEARRTIMAAAAGGRPYWAAIHVPGIEHPTWWPRTAQPVPGFEHMIIGAREAGIGMHRDRHCSGGGEERLVSTYLALGCGRKHVVLLPPSAAGAEVAERLGGAGCDDEYGRQSSQRAKLPPRPEPGLLCAVVEAGGYWFTIEATRGEGAERPASSSEDEDDEVTAAAERPASEVVAVDVGDDEKEGSEEEESEEEESEEDDHLVPMAVFLPAGWYHWLVGDAPWHVAWSGSIFPTSHKLEKGAGAKPRPTSGRRATKGRR